MQSTNTNKHYSRAYLARLEKYNNNVHHQLIISIIVHTKLRDPARSTSSCVRTTDGGGSDNHLGVHIISIGNTILWTVSVSRRGDRAHVVVFSAQESHDVSRSHPVLNLHFENELVVSLIHQTDVMYQRLNHCHPRVPQSFSSVVVDVVDGQQVIECAIINLEKIEW